MDIQEKNLESYQISQEKLLAVISAAAGRGVGREDDDHPLPPGPWDPVIRQALEQVGAFGPLPDPWRSSSELFKLISAFVLLQHPQLSDAIHPHNPIDRVSLNPQPLPPRWAFLAALTRIVIGRAELMQDIADSASSRGEKQGIIIVGGYPARFADELCPSPFRFKWKWPGPPPHWFGEKLEGVDLLFIAAQFNQAAREAFSPALRQGLTDAAAKFAKAGLSRMP